MSLPVLPSLPLLLRPFGLALKPSILMGLPTSYQLIDVLNIIPQEEAS